MFTIIKRRELNPTVTELWIHAPLIAKKAKAGQFIIVRAKEDSERIPLTIAGFDREAGTVSIIFQVVGAGTMQLNALKEGEAVHDFVGPLGKATEIEGLKNVCVVGGGVGCAIALPIAQALHAQGTKVTGIVGFRNKDLVILEDEFRACCDEFIIMTDDVVNERFVYEVPGGFREGVNYLGYASAEECVAQVDLLMRCPDAVQRMKEANAAYYREWLRPDALVGQALRQAEML